jgi:hypothetical protein
MLFRTAHFLPGKKPTNPESQCSFFAFLFNNDFMLQHSYEALFALYESDKHLLWCR